MWCEMKQWIKDGGGIEEKEEIYNDLIAPQAWVNSRSKFQLESKDDMKERGMPSPNYGDALALTFAQPVQRKDSNKYRALRAAGQTRRAGAM